MSRIEVDEHLRQALRHAPDAELAAPAEIGAQIIAAAHRSAAEPPRAATAPRPRALAGAWWRWAGSGALASVLMAGFIAMQWRGEAPGPGRDEPAAVVAQAPAAPTPPPTSVATPAISARPAAPPAPVVAKPAPPVTRRDANRAAAEAPPAAPAAPAQAERQRAAAAPPRPPPATPLATNRAAQAAESALQDAARAPAAPAAAGTLAQQRLAAAPAARAAAPAPWRTMLRDGDELKWQSGTALRAPDSAWLGRMTELTRARWQIVEGIAPAIEARQLEWQRGGRSIGSLWFEPGAVRWCGVLRPCERASVDAEVLRTLLAELER